MGVILDTSVLIGAERDLFDMPAFLASLGDAPVSIAAISASELLHGVERAKRPAARAARGRFVEGILTNIPVIPFGLDEARMHARIWAGLAARGTAVSAHDLLIAATALSVGSAVATLDRRHFGRIKGLTFSPTEPFSR